MPSTSRPTGLSLSPHSYMKRSSSPARRECPVPPPRTPRRLLQMLDGAAAVRSQSSAPSCSSPAASRRPAQRRPLRSRYAYPGIPTVLFAGLSAWSTRRLRTIYFSFFDASGNTFAGLDNYQTDLHAAPDQLTVLRNTALWVVITPFVATAIGLIYAILVDRARHRGPRQDAFIFLPMAISFVGGLDHLQAHLRVPPRPVGHQADRPAEPGHGGDVRRKTRPQQWLINVTAGTTILLLIAILIWVQAGFAMTVLSAAIKAIPEDIVEAARLDGVGRDRSMFRFDDGAEHPTGASIVVLTTIGIATLKIFDIVRRPRPGASSRPASWRTSSTAQTFRAQNIRASARPSPSCCSSSSSRSSPTTSSQLSRQSEAR